MAIPERSKTTAGDRFRRAPESTNWSTVRPVNNSGVETCRRVGTAFTLNATGPLDTSGSMFRWIVKGYGPGSAISATRTRNVSAFSPGTPSIVAVIPGTPNVAPIAAPSPTPYTVTVVSVAGRTAGGCTLPMVAGSLKTDL
jgi:hypothetical protein